MMLVTLLCVACVASYAFGGERSVLPPAVLCDVSSSERTQLVVSAEGGTTSDLSNSFPFPTSPDDLEQLAGESWFTAFAYSREPCSRFCAELPFRNSSIRFHCAGTCDGSGSQPCVCDERPNLSARACTRHWGTKMCNCTRSAALEVASSLGMDALTTEPAFLPGDSSNRRFNPRLGLFESIHENSTVYPDSFEVLSSSPRILHFPKFISDEECDAFIDFGKERMSLSKKNLIRNRFVAHLPHDEMLANATLRRVLYRIARQTKQPVDTFQEFKLLKYNEDASDVPAFYFPHHDDQGWPSSNKVLTFIIYFSDIPVGGGGETVFCTVPVKGTNLTTFEPLGVGHWDSRMMSATEMEKKTWKVCNDPSYLKVRPRKGSALVFWNYHPNGVLDLRSFHGGCPVHPGHSKWMGQQWILGVPFVKSEWSGDNFRRHGYDNEWFRKIASREKRMAEQASARASASATVIPSLTSIQEEEGEEEEER